MRHIFIVALLIASACFGESKPGPPPRVPTTRPAGDDAVVVGFSRCAHDFYGPNAPLAVRCAPCHGSPAAARTTTTMPYVWSDDLQAPLPQRLFDVEPAHKLARSTVLCLSCHDGTIASEIVGGGDDDFFAAGVAVNPKRDHPVGVRYPPIQRDQFKLRRDYASVAKLESEGAIKLPQGRVECISCHDPHNALGIRGMLVKSDRRSALCLSCHLK